jgi:4-hydroxy-tetrahydrodipicolinate synthase
MKTIQGSIPAIITPMQDDGSLDLPGCGVCSTGTSTKAPTASSSSAPTGESPTVNYKEHCALIETTVKHVAGRIPGDCRHRRQLDVRSHRTGAFRRKAGADAHLSVVPYYNKPTQEGLYRHFKAIAEAVDLPHDSLQRAGTYRRRSGDRHHAAPGQVPGIVGIKDATGNIERGSDLLKRAPAGFSVYSGDDATAIALMLLGGKGSISVTANVAPALMHRMCAAAIAGDLATARDANFRLLGLHRNLFHEANPIPVKWAVQQMGLMVAAFVCR